MIQSKYNNKLNLLKDSYSFNPLRIFWFDRSNNFKFYPNFNENKSKNNIFQINLNLRQKY